MSSDRGVRERSAEKGHATDLPRYPASEDASESDGARAGDPPRWVAVAIVLVGVLVVLGLVVLHLSGGLGPGLHGGD